MFSSCKTYSAEFPSVQSVFFCKIHSTSLTLQIVRVGIYKQLMMQYFPEKEDSLQYLFTFTALSVSKACYMALEPVVDHTGETC